MIEWYCVPEKVLEKKKLWDKIVGGKMLGNQISTYVKENAKKSKCQSKMFQGSKRDIVHVLIVRTSFFTNFKITS